MSAVKAGQFDIKLLQSIEEPDLFVEKVLSAFELKENDSYEDNIFMRTMPKALSGKDDDFKNGALASIIEKADKVSGKERHAVIALIQAGANPNLLCKRERYDSELTCPLYQVSYSQDKAYAQALLLRKADVNIKTFGKLPVIWTAHTVELAKFLVEKGASATGRKSHGLTLLHQVMEHENYEPSLLRYYVSRGLDIHDQDNVSQATPLHDICSWPSEFNGIHQEKLKILLELGADTTTLTNNWGVTVLQKIENNIGLQDDEELRAHYQNLKDIILEHFYKEEAKRLRNICIDGI
jgi:hypothetical protein